MKLAREIFKKLFIPISFLFFVPTVVFAGPGGLSAEEINLCSFLGPLCGAINPDGDSVTGESAVSFVTERAAQIVSLVFIGIIVLAIFIIVRAAVRYIQSQDNEEQVELANKSIRSVFLGIALLFVGIVGIILVLSFFGGTGLIGSDLTLNEIFRLNS